MIDTILFDVDGTILDTEYVMIRSLQLTLKKLKGTEVPVDELNYILGIPGKKAIERYVEDEQEEKEMLKEWNENVRRLNHHTHVFEGVRESIKELKSKGFVLGIVTSKTRDEMNNEFKQFALDQYFNCIVTASDTTNHKPHPEPITKALKLLNKSPEKAVYIGDSIYDMRCAQQNHVLFALAKWGAVPNDIFSEADLILEQPSNLLSFLQEA